MRVLLAEDDVKLGKLIKHLLEKEALRVDWVLRGDAAIDYGLNFVYDVIILDWMMPGETGIKVCEHLRKKGYPGAILMLTAKDTVSDRVLGLNTGADDYLIKPFEFAELLARVRALSRRSNSKITEEILQVGSLTLNRTTRSVHQKDIEIQLTAREFQLLDLLMQNRGHIVSRNVILDRIWGFDADITSNNIDAYVRLIRKKISLPDTSIEIQNIRGIGFKLEINDVC